MAKMLFFLVCLPAFVSGVILHRRPQMEDERIQLQSVAQYNSTHLEQGWIPGQSSLCSAGGSAAAGSAAASSEHVPEESAVIEKEKTDYVSQKRGPKRRPFQPNGPNVLSSRIYARRSKNTFLIII